MSKYIDNLDYIIKRSFEETIEYFNKNGIKVEDDLELKILESIRSLIQKYGKDNVNKKDVGIYDSETKKIYIIKKPIRKFLDRVLINMNEIPINTIFTISNHKVLWPVYKDDDDIKNIIKKTAVESVVIHEIGHVALRSIGSNDEWKASFVEYLVYFYKNELYKYPEVYKIMEKNIKRCEKFIREKNPSPYSLGYCFANDIIYAYENILNKDKQSPKLNIKSMIEKLKYFSEDDGIKITEMFNALLKDYVNIKNRLNIKANMLIYLLEKLLI